MKVLRCFQWKSLTRMVREGAPLALTPALLKKPITRDEEIFIKMVMFHTSRVFYAMKDDLVINH